MKHAREETHPAFENQDRRHQKFKTVVSVFPQKVLMSSNSLFKKLHKYTMHFLGFQVRFIQIDIGQQSIICNMIKVREDWHRRSGNNV